MCETLVSQKRRRRKGGQWEGERREDGEKGRKEKRGKIVSSSGLHSLMTLHMKTNRKKSPFKIHIISQSI